MSKRLRSYRDNAALRQNWLCYYCTLPMGGDGSPYDQTLRDCRPQFVATAEHLQAQQDGGTDRRDNIVAAHAVCNRRRHRCKSPLTPMKFADRVQARVAKNRWFGSNELTLLRK